MAGRRRHHEILSSAAASGNHAGNSSGFCQKGAGENPCCGNFRMPCDRWSRRFWGTPGKSAAAGGSRHGGVLPVPDFAALKAGYNCGIPSCLQGFCGKTHMIMPVRPIPDAPHGGLPVTGEHSLAERVRIRLLLEPDLPVQSIRCHVFHGTAVLCGIVDSYRIRQRAQDALRLIPGVSLILNELVVWPCESAAESRPEYRAASS